MIERKVLPDILEKVQKENRAVKIWSAGCSNGAEPYTLAMIVLDVMQKRKQEQNVTVTIFVSDMMITVLKQL